MATATAVPVRPFFTLRDSSHREVVQRHSTFTGARLGAKASARARTRPVRLMTSASVLWKLEVNQEWCDVAAETCSKTFPLDLSAMINSQRPGPNKTWSIKVGRPREHNPEEGIDLELDIETVSGKHAEFEEDGNHGDLYVTDLESTNGTFVNGERITTKVKLSPGDTISFGENIVFNVTRDVSAHA